MPFAEINTIRVATSWFLNMRIHVQGGAFELDIANWTFRLDLTYANDRPLDQLANRAVFF